MGSIQSKSPKRKKGKKEKYNTKEINIQSDARSTKRI
jgi:hypothetical protein